MILETDKALLSLLRTEVLGDAPVAVAFDAPNRPWIQQVKGLVVNLYLYDVRENMQRREVMFTEIRDDKGKLVERRPPPRRYDLYYALTVWAPKVPLEHQVLACVLAGLSEYETIPAKYLPADLADSGHVVLLSVADGMKRGMLQNLAGELKMSLEVVVTVPIYGKMPLPLAPPVAKPVTLSVNGAERVEGRPVGAAPAGAGGPAGARPAGGAPAGAGPSAVRQQQQQAMVSAAKAAGAAPAGAAGQPGRAPQGQPAPQGQAAPQGQRPPQAGAPAQGKPGQAPPNPIALAQAALAQAAQSQAMLAQAQAALAKLLMAASGAAPAKAPTAAGGAASEKPPAAGGAAPAKPPAATAPSSAATPDTEPPQGGRGAGA